MPPEAAASRHHPRQRGQRRLASRSGIHDSAVNDPGSWPGSGEVTMAVQNDANSSLRDRARLAALSVAVAACSSGRAPPELGSQRGAPAVRAAGGSTQQAGTAGLTVPTANLPVLQKVGKGEGQLNLIAWEGYLDPSWVKPFQKQTGCSRQRQVRRQLRRDGLADEERRRRPVRHGLLLGRRGPAHPVRRRRAPGEHEPDPGLQGLLPGLPGAERSTPSTACTTASPCSGDRTS